MKYFKKSYFNILLIKKLLMFFKNQNKLEKFILNISLF